MALKHFLRTFQKSFSLLSFVLFIYFPTIWWSGGGTEQVARAGKRYLTIVLVQATITATRFAIEKRPRLRLIRRSRGFDQYTDQYQKISGWTQWTRQLFVPTENGAKSAGKHPIAGLLRPDASSHAGGHWFESSSLHQENLLEPQCFEGFFLLPCSPRFLRLRQKYDSFLSFPDFALIFPSGHCS